MHLTKYLLTAGFVATTFAATAQDSKLNDAQIAAIVVAANQIDIDAGKLAQSKAKNSEVKKFAQTMINDHSGVNKSAGELVTKLKVKPEENAVSNKLKADAKQTMDRLKKLNGDAFDRAYIDNEVAYHAAVLDAVDKALIPNASNAELKNMLVGVRPAFVAHLDHAKNLQTSLGQKTK